MNEQLQTKLVEILGNIQSATKSAGDFALSQLPDLAQSYILYGRVVETFTVLTSLLVFILSCWLLFLCISKFYFAEGGDIDLQGMGIVLTLISGSISFIVGLCNLSSLFLVWLAPKVWLIKELATLIK
jgi:hypothetical protein